MRQKIYFTVGLVIIVIVVGILSVKQRSAREDLVFEEALAKAAVTVDERELTLRDIAFYIAYQENKIEEEACVYNMEDPGEYWRMHTNGSFIREEGKQTALAMAVHDEIFYQMALLEGIELTEEEIEHLANDQYDFWSDLEENQRAALGVGEEVIYDSMEKLAIAEKYQYLLCEMNGKAFEEYSVGGQAYERLLESHVCAVNESVWDRVNFGGITVNH